LISNLILLGPLAAVLARWRPPVGLATVTWVAVNVMTAAAFDLDLQLALAVGAAGGLVADLVIRVSGAGPSNRIGTLLTLTVSPIVAWSVYFFGVGMFGDLQWPPEIWGGAIVFAALSGAAMTTLSRPKSSPNPDETMAGVTYADR
jgi:hypothetical protein